MCSRWLGALRVEGQCGCISEEGSRGGDGWEDEHGCTGRIEGACVQKICLMGAQRSAVIALMFVGLKIAAGDVVSDELTTVHRRFLGLLSIYSRFYFH